MQLLRGCVVGSVPATARRNVEQARSSPKLGMKACSPVPVRNAAITASAAASDMLSDKCINVQGPSCVLMSWDDAAEAQSLNTSASEAWNDWLAQELAAQLVGVKAKTSRARVKTSAVRSADVHKGRIRANELDLVLELEGTHLKEAGVTITGSIRVILKTENQKDQICLSPVQWDKTPANHPAQALADINVAAESPLESALAEQLNAILWEVEKRSLDSMDSAGSMDSTSRKI